MSLSTLQSIECPVCKCKGEMVLHNSINTGLTPELKEKILCDDIFLWPCPKCGTKVMVFYSFLYHDMGKRCMIAFDLLEDEESSELKSSGYQDLILNKSNYSFRVVNDIDRLKEKIAILDANLDDVVIEYIKYCIRYIQQAEEFDEGEYLVFDKVHLDEDGKTERLYFSIMNSEDESTYGISICKRDYEGYALKVQTDPRLQALPFTNVCEKWIKSKLRQIC